MKVIVHCGLPKTGSTSIQKTLYDNHEVLLSEGVRVPIYGATTPAHHKLVVSSSAGVKFSPKKFSSKSQALTDSRSDLVGGLREAKAKSQPVILSSETFSNRGSFDSMVELRQILADNDASIEALAYIRPPLQHLPSSIQQEAKNYMLNESLSKKLFAHISRAARVQELFGNDNVDLRIFDRSTLNNADVVSDFFEWVRRKGVGAPDVPAASNKNEAIGAPACAMLWKLKGGAGKTAIHEPGDFAKVRRLIIEYEAVNPSRKLTVPQEWEETINRTVAEKWNELLAQSSNSDEEKRRFALKTEAAETDIDTVDKNGWILSSYDADYVERVTAWGEGSDDADFKKVTPLVRKKLL